MPINIDTSKWKWPSHHVVESSLGVIIVSLIAYASLPPKVGTAAICVAILRVVYRYLFPDAPPIG